MRRLRLEVARTVAALGSTARRRGRDIVMVSMSAELPGRLARAGLGLAAGPVRAVGLVGVRWSAVSPRGLAARAYDGLVALLPDGPSPALVLAELRVSRELDLSLRLTGPADRLAQVTGLALATGAEPVAVPTVRAQQDDALWLSGELPAARFDEPGSRYRLLVLGPAGAVRVRAGRTRVQHRWSRRHYDQDRWPVRVRLNWRRQLVVAGHRPPGPDFPYTVLAQPNALVLSWEDPATAASLARFTHRGTREVVVADASRTPAGMHQVRLDLDELVDAKDDWDIEVISTTRGPVRLRSRPGTNPPLRGIVRYPETYGRTKQGPAWGTIRLGADNTLVARVRPAADS